jgi:hypothetical protein
LLSQETFMQKAAVTRIVLATLVGGVALTAFRPPVAETAIPRDKRTDHMVINAVISTMFTGQAALRGIVLVDSTIPALEQPEISDRKSKFLMTFFPNHAQLVSMTAKDFLKTKPRLKLERVLLDTRTKIEFLSTEEAQSMGLSWEAPSDSSWRVFKEKYPDASRFVAFSLPGYDSSRDLALVSYFLLCAPGCYQKGLALVERNPNNNQWRQLHRAVIFGGG